MNEPKVHRLDITREICPLTFVRTKLLLERMMPGEIAEIRLKGAEPLTNVPRSLKELGVPILDLAAEDPAQDSPDSVHLLRFRKP